MPSDVEFEKRSISFIGREMGVPVSKAYAMMKVLGNGHELVPEMFRKIQRLDKPLRSEAELRNGSLSMMFLKRSLMPLTIARRF